MANVKLIGRPIDYYGKPLMQILLNLKNFGIGRYVVRSYWERYKEKSYYKIVNVQPHMDEENRSGHVLVEKVFRGRHFGIQNISGEAFKADFQLVPKHLEENLVIPVTSAKMRLIPREVEPPPLLKLMLEEEKQKLGEEVKDLKLAVVAKPTPFYRFVNPNETPCSEFSLGLGKPASPLLYDVSYFDINATRKSGKEGKVSTEPEGT